MINPIGNHDFGYGSVDNTSNNDDSNCNAEIYSFVLAIFFMFACGALFIVNSRLKRQVTHYRKQNQGISGDNIALQKKVEALKLQVLDREKKPRSSSSSSSEARLSSEITSLKQQVRSYQISVSKVQRDLDTTNVEAERLRVQIQEKMKVDGLLSKSQFAVKQLQLIITSLEKKELQLRNQSVIDTQKICDLQDLIKDHQKKHVEMLKKVEDIQRSVIDTFLEFSQLQEQLKVSQETIVKLEAQKQNDEDAFKATFVKLALLTTIK